MLFPTSGKEKTLYSILQAEAVGVSIPGAYASVAGDNTLQQRCCNIDKDQKWVLYLRNSTIHPSISQKWSYVLIIKRKILFWSSNTERQNSPIYELAATLPADTLLLVGQLKPQQPTAHFSTFTRRTKPDTEANLAKEQKFCDTQLLWSNIRQKEKNNNKPNFIS